VNLQERLPQRFLLGAVSHCPAWNGVATSPSPFQSLSHGDEDIATQEFTDLIEYLASLK
jgi:hypothetical protein